MRKILLVFSSLISIKYVIALNLSPLFNFNFTYCKSFALEENTLTHSFQNRYSKQINHFHQGFPYGWGDQDIPLRNGTLVFLQALKFEFSPSVGYHPRQKVEFPHFIPDHRPHIGKKDTSNSF